MALDTLINWHRAACTCEGEDRCILCQTVAALAGKNELLAALEPFVAGFKSDPGTSDLDAEQPIIARVSLGDWRKARAILAKATAA